MDVLHRNCLGFDGYTVSSDGLTVTSYKRKQPHVLKTYALKSGYVVVTLRRDCRPVRKRMHHLVLEAFVGPRPPGMVGCHYPDRSRNNNSIDNLRWDTPRENEKDKWRHKIHLTEKTCTRCKETLAIKDDYYNDRRNPDGKKSQCKTCHNKVCMKTRSPENHRRLRRESARRTRAARKIQTQQLEVA